MISTDQLYVVQLTHKVKKENIVNTALFIFSPVHFLMIEEFLLNEGHLSSFLL